MSDPVLLEWRAPPPSEAEVTEAAADLVRLLEQFLFRAVPMSFAGLVGLGLAIEWATEEPLPYANAFLVLTLVMIVPFLVLYGWLRSMPPAPLRTEPLSIALKASGLWIDGRRVAARAAMRAFAGVQAGSFGLRVQTWGSDQWLRIGVGASLTPEELRTALRALGVPEESPPAGGHRHSRTFES